MLQDFFRFDSDHTFFLDEKSRQKNQELIKTCRYFGVPILGLELLSEGHMLYLIAIYVLIVVYVSLVASNKLMSSFL